MIQVRIFKGKLTDLTLETEINDWLVREPDLQAKDVLLGQELVGDELVVIMVYPWDKDSQYKS